VKGRLAVAFGLASIATGVLRYHPEWVGLGTPDVPDRTWLSTSVQCDVYRRATGDFVVGLHARGAAIHAAASPEQGHAALTVMDRWLDAEVPALVTLVVPPALADHHHRFVGWVERYHLYVDGLLLGRHAPELLGDESLITHDDALSATCADQSVSSSARASAALAPRG
jgi:hypothetical protein